MEWIYLARDKNEFSQKGHEPPCSVKCGNFLTSLRPISFSRTTLLHRVSWLVISASDYKQVPLSVAVV
jgi:hypothetical protein